MAVGELEVDLRKAERTVVAEMCDDGPRWLEGENLRPRSSGMPHQVDEDVAVVAGDDARRGEVVRPGQFDVPVGRSPERSR